MFRDMKRGFTLVESLIATAIFALLAGVIYQTSALLIRTVGVYRENVTISSLANEYMEIVHNLPYSSVGTLNGVPTGPLPDSPNSATTTVNGTSYQIYYAVRLVDDPADGTAEGEDEDNDQTPADYKQVKLFIKNLKNDKSYSFLTSVTPKGLEGMDGGGAIAVTVFDASGRAVPGALVNISNTALSPNINIPDLPTDSAGKLVQVGLATSSNSYHITVSKSGYSSDATYPVTGTNPSPTKPDWTVGAGQVSNVSLAIDKLSDLTVNTVDTNCAVLPNIDIKLAGEKMIGSNLPKFDNNYTSNSSGIITLNNIEWDNYIPTALESNYTIHGTSPTNRAKLLPDTEQSFTLHLGNKSTNSFWVTVIDDSTDTPIENASVTLESSSPSYAQTKITGGSVWSTANWDYVTTDDNLSVGGETYALRLLDFSGTFVSNGVLISEVFDTGFASTSYQTLSWEPQTNPASTTIKFQIATSDTSTTSTVWNYLGPDGNSGSYYTISNNDILSPDGRYVRYKVIMETEDTSRTPVLTNVNVNYVSSCQTPGQVFFSGLSAGANYALEVSADGYTTQNVTGIEISGNDKYEIRL
jgi:prepilin-type N-terminal cleavage/methylation domain-containing protein